MSDEIVIKACPFCGEEQEHHFLYGFVKCFQWGLYKHGCPVAQKKLNSIKYLFNKITQKLLEKDESK